ncbi:xylan alpha-(1-_2)-glucuronosidase [Lactococcus hodotermopsidis]|uniref:Xylan alpha-(1->2)-glucuronosidase n=1 Tax=Pseudolactococcus hodotermopsidis TaxID=2709157 RepID=A0A6A0BDZ9_9LACT|nr:alpha-glucuronidase [Lactococcus hodotermopsidis]GFH42057.1 xylan alpha-(1->2)-glucuronosidase [Lactococcus hodotermopsidis]
MSTRDTCWLNKKIANKHYQTYYLAEKSPLATTIRAEFAVLFANASEVDEKDKATIVFERVLNAKLGVEGFEMTVSENVVTLSATSDKGLLYGFYHLYTQLAQDKAIQTIVSVPDQAIRMINHWDNMDGSIERGYAGESIYFKDNKFRRDFETIRDYARLWASVGINAISINNVNVHKYETRLILEENLPEVKYIADIFSSYGIKTYLSVNFASPKIVGGLTTSDPLDEGVNDFWAAIAKNIYRAIPDFGGFVVKADSEGEPGPFTYGRGHDDGANMFARALAPFGGHVIWRCFVYDCAQDWRDRSIDRARAAYDHFIGLDGKFDDNVTLQIKLGPIDFQTREPVTPLFGGLKKTNHIIEFQITQEYTGHQKHIYYLAPVWKEALDFDTKVNEKENLVKNLLKENSVISERSGIAAVGSVGMDKNWTHHKLMQSNLFAYGRLCWSNQLTSKEIAEEWLALSFDLSQEAAEKVLAILLTSRETYEFYTAPLGIGFMVKPHLHYGPDIDGYEYDRWGTYHFADRNGIGVNRTSIDGTGYAGQYAKQREAEYNDLATCPDNLVLFFHHLPYTHVLHSGKTLIQHIYDTHFEGVARVENYIATWDVLSEEMPAADFENVKTLLQEQHRVAKDWRDQVNTYFLRKSGIADEKGRHIYA